MKRRYQVPVIVLLALVCVVSVAHAATSDTGSFGPSPVPLGDLTAALYVYALKIVGLCIFVMFLIAGLAYMIPMLQKTVGNPVQIMQDAVIGLVILVSAYVILNSIHPMLIGTEGGEISLPATNGGNSSGTGFATAPVVSVAPNATTTLRSGDSAFTFQSAGANCGATIPCQPGYTCQGAICKWAQPASIPLHSFCMNGGQCSGGNQCVEQYNFRNDPGKVRICCAMTEISVTGIAGDNPTPFCAN